MASFTHVENFGVHAPRLIQIDGHDPVRVSLEAPLKYGPELQLGIMQLEREGSPPPGLRLPQAKLSRKSNQVARGRIRRFESYMPSHAVVSNLMNLKTAHRPCSRTAGARQGRPRLRLIDANVRSTIHRLGSTSNPAAASFADLRNKPLYRVLDIDGLIGFEPEFRRMLNCRPGRDRQRGIKFELADGDWMTSSLPKNSEAGDAKLDGRVRSPVGAVAQGNSTSPGPHGTREARSAEPSGAFSGLQLTADETPNENRRDKRKTRRIASAVETQGVSPRPGPPMFLRDSATLVPDRGLGVRRVGRVLQDVTHEIERGVKRLVVLRIWRNIGLRAGLLVPFGLQVSAQ